MKNLFNIIEKHDITYNNTGRKPMKFVGGLYATLIDERGKEYIDLNEITALIGQKIPEIDNKIIEAIKNSLSSPKGTYNDGAALLTAELIRLTDGDFQKIFLSASGSESVDWAIRVARNRKQKNLLLAFDGSLHGRTYLSACASGIARRKSGLGVNAPDIIFAPYPTDDESLRQGLCLIEKHRALLCGVIIEPFTGSTGMQFPAAGALTGIARAVKENELVLIFDEIQTAFGKTGAIFEYQNIGVIPDILVLGKGLGNGAHISALLFSDDVVANLDGGKLAGGTGHNPLACHCAVAVIDYLTQTDILARVKELGGVIKQRLAQISRFDSVAGSRGKGVAQAIEFTSGTMVKTVISEGLARGLLLGGTDKTLFFRPPLTISEEQCRKALNIIEEIIEERECC